MKSFNELMQELDNLKKGYISEKRIHRKTYFYLQYKIGNKILSEYIKEKDLERVKTELRKREEIEKIIKHTLVNIKTSPILSKNDKALTGSLMSKDVAVAKFDNGNLIYLNEKLCPLFILRTKNITEFLKNRCIDSTRVNSRLIKKVINVKETDDYLISLKSHGAMITDTYWFKARGSKLRYKDICFDNDIFSDLALKGIITYYPKNKSPLSPELTNIGSFEKCWKYINQEWWMYKQGSNEQIYSEILASRIAKLLDIPTAFYEYHNGYIRTRNFAKGFNFEPISSIAGEDSTYENVFNSIYKINSDIAKQYLRLMYFDALVFNVDRHNENCGIIRDIKTGRIISLAPNYDNNMAIYGYSKNLKKDNSNDGLILRFVDFIKRNKTANKLFREIKFPNVSYKQLEILTKNIGVKANDKEAIEFIMNRYKVLKNRI